MKLPEPPHLREINRDDEQECNLVLAGWLRTYVGQSYGVERSVFFRMCQPIVKRLLAESTVVVACMPEAHDAVLGWVAFDGDVLHYVCCKPRWQRLGVGTLLLQDFAGHHVRFTHKTNDGMKLLGSVAPIPEFTYDPLARFPQEQAA